MATNRTKDVERLTVELPQELAKRVSDYRFDNRIASKVAALRDLIEAGLEAKGQRKVVP